MRTNHSFFLQTPAPVTANTATGTAVSTPLLPKNPIANLHIPATTLPPVPIVLGIAPIKVTYIKPNTSSSARYVLLHFICPLLILPCILSNFYLIDYLARHEKTKVPKLEFDSAWTSVTSEVRTVSTFCSSLYVFTDAHQGL